MFLSDEFLTEILPEHEHSAARAFAEAFGVDEDSFSVSEFEDSYQGVYISDTQFAEMFADMLGIDTNLAWPFSCIDWEHAARELMYDYTEENGHYFRNI